MNDNFRKVEFKFQGESNPTADECIQMIKSIQKTVPPESKKTLRIEKIQSGSVDIHTFFESVMDIFQNESYATFWDVLTKVGGLCAATDYLLYKPLKGMIQKFKSKSALTKRDVEELLNVLNSDPNIIRTITHEDFKNISDLAEIVRKRGVVLINGEVDNLEINKDSAELIQKISAVDMNENLDDIAEEMILHLEITRVSFTGNEQWRAVILEDNTKKKQLISIEDQNLLASISQNEIFFSGKEVIEAVVRIERNHKGSKYTLIQYLGMTTINHIK